MKLIKISISILSLLGLACAYADEWYSINTLNSASSEYSQPSQLMMGEDINNDNDIVGYAFIEQADGRSLRQLAVTVAGEVNFIDSERIDISPEDIAFHSLKINDSGQVIGNYRNSLATSATPNASFIYIDGELQNLGSLSLQEGHQKGQKKDAIPAQAKQYTNAYDINNKGEVIGISSRADGTAASFLWANGKMVDFNTLHPSFINRFYAFPEAINDNSDILIRNDRSKYTVFNDGQLSELDIPIHCDNNIINIKAFTNNRLIAADCRNFKDGLSFEAIVYDVTNGKYTNVAQSLGLPERSVQMLDLNENGIALLRYSYAGALRNIVYDYHANSYIHVSAYLDPADEEMFAASVSHLDSINDSDEILAGKYIFSSVNNLPPYFDSMTTQEITKGEVLSYLVPGAEYDMEYGNEFTFSSNELPDGAFLDPQTGEFTWMPSTFQHGTYFINITLTDNAIPAGSHTDILEVVVKNPNSAPTLKAVHAQGANLQANHLNSYDVDVSAGDLVTLDIEFNDIDGDELLIAVDGIPSNAKVIDIYSNFIKLRWQTTGNDTGTYELRFQSMERANPFVSSPLVTVFVNVDTVRALQQGNAHHGALNSVYSQDGNTNQRLYENIRTSFVALNTSMNTHDVKQIEKHISSIRKENDITVNEELLKVALVRNIYARDIYPRSRSNKKIYYS